MILIDFLRFAAMLLIVGAVLRYLAAKFSGTSFGSAISYAY